MDVHAPNGNNSYGHLPTTVYNPSCNAYYMKENLSDRLKRLRNQAGLSQQRAADSIGVSRVAVTKWESGQTKDIRHDSLMGLARLYGISIEELLSGVEGDAGRKTTTDLPHPTDDEFAMVQQLDINASCGNGHYVEHVVVKGGLAFKRSSLREFGVTEHDAKVVYARGGSMWPTIQDGCVVLLNTADREPREGKVFAICTPDGDLVLKRLVWEYSPAMGCQAWIMRSDNPDKTAHPDKIVPPDDRTMIVGRAVWNDNRL